MMKAVTWAALVILASGASASAQGTDRSLLESVLEAILLPAATQDARTLGVPEADVRSIFTTARERRLPPRTIREIFVESNNAIREHGPIDNFGAFVQQKLDQGLRGRDLGEAIRAEHAKRGVGKGKVRGRSDEHPGAPGESDDHDGKADETGKSSDRDEEKEGR